MPSRRPTLQTKHLTSRDPRVSGLRTWVEIDRKAIVANLRRIRREAGEGVQVMAVVKSNAYGHGLRGVAETVEQAGGDWLGLDSITEAASLRHAGARLPLLVLGHTLPERLEEAAAANIAVTLSTREAIRALTRLGRAPRAHLKIDTGMHRQGFLPEEVPAVARLLRREGVALEGTYTHSASANNPRARAEVLQQLHAFHESLAALRHAGVEPGLCHAAASGGFLTLSASRLDLVRCGALLYGFWPSGELARSYAKKFPIIPALSWHARIAEVKRLPKGAAIGYDATERVRRATTIAILPVGYWHGYPRALSGRGVVLIGGVRAKVLGRVSMDMLAVDATDARRVRVGDMATLIGADGRERISAEWLAEEAGSTPHELLTRLNPLMRRIYR